MRNNLLLYPWYFNFLFFYPNFTLNFSFLFLLLATFLLPIHSSYNILYKIFSKINLSTTSSNLLLKKLVETQYDTILYLTIRVEGEEAG